MSAQNVRSILLRAQSDHKFYKKIQSDPKNALRGYALTDKERKAIISGDPSLRQLALPRKAGGKRSQRETIITFVFMHNWLLAADLQRGSALTPQAADEVKALAKRVLTSRGAEETALLIDLMQLLDGRKKATR